MPNMNGLAFLDKLMRLHPLPVVMVSTLTTKGASETLLALELGAVDFVAKPVDDLAGGLEAFGANLRERSARPPRARSRSAAQRGAGAEGPADDRGGADGALIAIGASTGGVEAIRVVLADMPPDCPPIVIAQHMPAGFTARFAARLDELSDAHAWSRPRTRMPLEPGHAYVARGRLPSAGRAELRPAQMPAGAGRADLGPPAERRRAVRVGGRDGRAAGGRARSSPAWAATARAGSS